MPKVGGQIAFDGHKGRVRPDEPGAVPDRPSTFSVKQAGPFINSMDSDTKPVRRAKGFSRSGSLVCQTTWAGRSLLRRKGTPCRARAKAIPKISLGPATHAYKFQSRVDHQRVQSRVVRKLKVAGCTTGAASKT